jgi:hypothetical protein
MKSMSVENLSPKNIPHREIRPLKITGKFVFRPILVAKCPILRPLIGHFGAKLAEIGLLLWIDS